MHASPQPHAAGDAVDPATRHTRRTHHRGWYVLLLPPFIGLLWVPWYAKSGPKLWGFPFFYWYQFAWVIVGAALTALVYVLTTSSDESPAYPPEQRTAAERSEEAR